MKPAVEPKSGASPPSRGNQPFPQILNKSASAA